MFPELSEIILAKIGDIVVFKQDFTRGGFFELKNCPACCCFSAPAFSNKSEGLTPRDMKAYPVYGLYVPQLSFIDCPMINREIFPFTTILVSFMDFLHPAICCYPLLISIQHAI